MKSTTTLGTPGSFARSLCKLQIIEALKLIDGDSVFATQCRIGAADPAMHGQVIQDIRDQMIDNYPLVEKMLGTDLLFLIYKYNRL